MPGNTQLRKNLTKEHLRAIWESQIALHEKTIKSRFVSQHDRATAAYDVKEAERRLRELVG